jgi:hypothetical protein
VDKDEARKIGEQLAMAVDPNSETQWAYWAALWSFPSPPVVDPWQPRQKPTVSWLDNDCLVTVQGREEATVLFLGRPVVGSPWKFEATYQSAKLDNHGFTASGLKTEWAFQLPGGEAFSLAGEIFIGRDEKRPDGAELLAQSIASRMMGRPADLTVSGDSV